MQHKFIKNIPNIITISRMISSLMGAVLFLSGAFIPSLICYTYGAISDFLDGHFAKKLNAYSDLGRKLDAISDKIYALSLGAPAILSGNLLMLIPLYFEGKIGFYNKKREKKGHKVYTKRVGKFKTAMLFPSLISGLIASKVPFFYLVSLPFLYYTTKLQIKTYQAYKNDEEIKTNIEKITENSGCEHEKMKVSKKINILKEELAFYANYYEPCENQTHAKTKKRVIK